MVLKGIRFYIYEFIYEDSFDLHLISKKFIVLKFKNIIIKWTDFHKYIKKKNIKNIRKDNARFDLDFIYITKFLNYIYFENYHIEKISDLTVEMIKTFLNDYALHNLTNDNKSTHRKIDTIEVVIDIIKNFVIELINTKAISIKYSELFKTIEIYSKRKHDFVTKTIFNFDVVVLDQFSEEIFRDIPTEAFSIIMNQVYINHPQIMMLCALCAFAGLRPSEACNVRREDSYLGSGLIFTYVGNSLRKVEIDLRKEINLRSDFKKIGGIKKHRIAKVYPGLINSFNQFYTKYQQYINNKSYESEYGPLSTARNGKAITYPDFKYEFSKVIKESIPILERSSNEEVAYYGRLLKTHSISPHILRHWFTVHLVVNGAVLSELMEFRGDSSEESSLTYLKNKSELIKKHNLLVENTFDFLQWKAAYEFK